MNVIDPDKRNLTVQKRQAVRKSNALHTTLLALILTHIEL